MSLLRWCFCMDLAHRKTYARSRKLSLLYVVCILLQGLRAFPHCDGEDQLMPTDYFVSPADSRTVHSIPERENSQYAYFQFIQAVAMLIDIFTRVYSVKYITFTFRWLVLNLFLHVCIHQNCARICEVNIRKLEWIFLAVAIFSRTKMNTYYEILSHNLKNISDRENNIWCFGTKTSEWFSKPKVLFNWYSMHDLSVFLYNIACFVTFLILAIKVDFFGLP